MGKRVTGICHNCGDLASGPRSFYCDECRPIVRRAQRMGQPSARRRRKRPDHVCVSCRERLARSSRALYCEPCYIKVKLESKKAFYLERQKRTRENAHTVLNYVINELIRLREEGDYGSPQLTRLAKILEQIRIRPEGA